MATVPNKDRLSPQYADKHILSPADLRTTETTEKVRPGVASANPLYVPPA